MCVMGHVLTSFLVTFLAAPSNAMVGMKMPQPGGTAMPSGPHIVQGYHPYKR